MGEGWDRGYLQLDRCTQAAQGGLGLGEQVAQWQHDLNGTSQGRSQRDVHTHSCTFFSCVCVWYPQGWAESRWPLAKSVRVQGRWSRGGQAAAIGMTIPSETRVMTTPAGAVPSRVEEWRIVMVETQF